MRQGYGVLVYGSGIVVLVSIKLPIVVCPCLQWGILMRVIVAHGHLYQRIIRLPDVILVPCLYSSSVARPAFVLRFLVDMPCSMCSALSGREAISESVVPMLWPGSVFPVQAVNNAARRL